MGLFARILEWPWQPQVGSRDHPSLGWLCCVAEGSDVERSLGHRRAVEAALMSGGPRDLYFLFLQENRGSARDRVDVAWKCLPYELMVEGRVGGGGGARRNKLIRGEIEMVGACHRVFWGNGFSID
jgi:hypothetical protein